MSKVQAKVAAKGNSDYNYSFIPKNGLEKPKYLNSKPVKCIIFPQNQWTPYFI